MLVEFLQHPPKHDRLIVLGATGNWAFAAGTVLLALKRHHQNLDADILLLNDGQILPTDAEIFAKLDCRLFHGTYRTDYLSPDILKIFSALSLAKFFCFDLLKFYEKVIWLDSDIIIQDDLNELWDYGPFSMAT